MATLSPQFYPFEDKKLNESWDQYRDRADEVYRKLTEVSVSLPEGEVVGAFVRFQIADGYANYVVTKAKPLTLQCVALGDGYQIPMAHMRGIRKADILAMIKQEKAWNELFKKKS